MGERSTPLSEDNDVLMQYCSIELLFIHVNDSYCPLIMQQAERKVTPEAVSLSQFAHTCSEYSTRTVEYMEIKLYVSSQGQQATLLGPHHPTK
jgi:hypothetical protein